MTKSILFVDDDRMVLNALERTFFETEFTVFCSINADDALQILASEHIDMVVSDIQMFPVSGYEFLKIVQTRYPSIIRLVLSAFSDREMVIKIICEGLAKVYILKPWDNKKLIEQIIHLFELYQSLEEMKKKCDIVLQNHIPSLPDIYTRMMQMIGNDCSLKELATLIETDPASCVNILKLANSSFYGMKITTIHQALVYLGINTVKDLVLVEKLFSVESAIDNRDLKIQLNRHMIISSTLLHGLYQWLFSKRIPQEYSIVGLLADIGRYILLENKPDDYQQILDTFEKDQTSDLNSIENVILDVSHSEIGARILDWWNLPASTVEACLYHHATITNSSILPAEIQALIHIADTYAWHIAECFEQVPLLPEIVKSLSIDINTLDENIASIINKDDFNK
jgi:HD-like signal output (HDOD) protein/CheY-like chemotaxis protein